MGERRISLSTLFKYLYRTVISRCYIPAKHSGQIVVEYILLLVVAVGIAAFITSFMVSRNPDEPGFLISKWQSIVNAIGSDEMEPEQPGN